MKTMFDSSVLVAAMGSARQHDNFDRQQEIDSELQGELEQSDTERRIAPPSNLLLRLRAQGRL